MKKNKLRVSIIALLSLIMTVSFVWNQNETVQASTSSAALTKYVQGIKLYGNYVEKGVPFIDTPAHYYYNDGQYAGYLQRTQSDFVHNASKNLNRWQSIYAGTTYLIVGGKSPDIPTSKLVTTDE